MAVASKPQEVQSCYITPEGVERLREELRYLWKEERPRVTRAVTAAAAEGDRSENAEYIYGKKRLREIDRRVRFLVKRLDSLTVVENRTVPCDTIYFGAWVRLEDEAGEEVVYRVVGPDEFDPKLGWISMDAPMGRALLGKKEGEEILVKRPVGDALFTVLEVSYTPLVL
jgi:transcription elongation factor GreB